MSPSGLSLLVKFKISLKIYSYEKGNLEDRHTGHRIYSYSGIDSTWHHKLHGTLTKMKTQKNLQKTLEVFCGANGIRTSDTRIFSPYDTDFFRFQLVKFCLFILLIINFFVHLQPKTGNAPKFPKTTLQVRN